MRKVTSEALAKRINRQLIKQGRQLRKTRSWRAQVNLGDYYITDTRRNFVVASNIDLEAYGRNLGVLHANEQLERR